MHKQFTDNLELLFASWKDKVGSQNSTSVQFSDVVSYVLHSKTGFQIPTKISFVTSMFANAIIYLEQSYTSSKSYGDG